MAFAVARSGQRLRRTVSGSVIVTGDIEAPQAGRQDQAQPGDAADRAATIGMAGRTTRSDSIVSRPSPAAITSVAVPKRDAVAEQMTHRPARRGERRLARSVAFEPGAQDAGDDAVEIGDGRKERRPDLARRVVMGTVVASRVEAQRIEIAHIRDATAAEIDFGYRPADRLGDANSRRAASGEPLADQRSL